MKKPLLILVFLIMLGHAYSQETYHILISAGEKRNNLPVLRYLPADDPRFSHAKYLFENTFIATTNELYRMLQQYLVNKGERRTIEPAFLYLSNRQGGFPMVGFYLKSNDSILDRFKTFYIDLADIEKDAARINTVTQIFPHEMSHIFLMMLAPSMSDGYNPYSSDMHYFSVTTNYLTAFSEGFAEHTENAARLFEKDQKIRQGIAEHTLTLERSTLPLATRLDHDFRFPLRMDFYRSAILFWYQKFENYKRYQWAVNMDMRMTNSGISTGDPEKALQYRNAGLGFEGKRTRNIAQVASNEGMINAFFTRLMMSDAKDHFQPSDFYKSFFPDTTASANKVTDPIINHFLKIFVVLHRQMDHAAGDTSFLQMFITGYGREFPQEKHIPERIFEELTGRKFTSEPVPEIWLMKNDHQHHFLVLDQFGSTTVPYYTMNLNTADEYDLAAFPELDQKQIRAILDWRDRNNGFKNIGDLAQVPGLSAESVKVLNSAHQQLKSDTKEEETPGIDIVGMLISNLGRVLLNALGWFAVFLVIFYFIFLHKKYSVKKVLIISLQKFLKYYMLVITALAFIVIFPGMIIPAFLIFLVVILLTDLLKTRADHVKRTEVLVTTVLMGLMIVYSLI